MKEHHELAKDQEGKTSKLISMSVQWRENPREQINALKNEITRMKNFFDPAILCFSFYNMEDTKRTFRTTEFSLYHQITAQKYALTL